MDQCAVVKAHSRDSSVETPIYTISPYENEFFHWDKCFSSFSIIKKVQSHLQHSNRVYAALSASNTLEGKLLKVLAILYYKNKSFEMNTK